MTDDRFDGSLNMFNILDICYLKYFSYLCIVVFSCPKSLFIHLNFTDDGEITSFTASRLWTQRACPALLRATYLRQPCPQMADGGAVTPPRIDGGTVSAGTQKTRQDLLARPSAGHFRGYRRALMRDDARLIATMRDLSLPCVPMHAPLLKMVVSLHLKTVGKWPISDSFSQSAFALPSLCLRFRRRRRDGDRREGKRKEN